MVFDTTTGQLKYCNGTAWVEVSSCAASTVPSGAIMGFNGTSCPSGWSEYTVARGRFLRGIDNGAGIDPSGTRAVGNVQPDGIKNHTHTFTMWTTNNEGANYGIGTNATFASRVMVTPGSTVGTKYSGAGETRPDNVATTFCKKN